MSPSWLFTLTQSLQMAASDINTDSTLPTAVADESNTGSSPVVVETMEKMDKASEIAKLGSERLDYQVNSSPSRKTKKKASPKVAIIRSVEPVNQARLSALL